MNDIELKNKVIKFLERKSYSFKTFPQEFTARETAESVGGVTTRIGFVAEKAVRELRARGVKIRYNKSTTPRKFIISGRE